jgi:hypothetical protein
MPPDLVGYLLASLFEQRDNVDSVRRADAIAARVIAANKRFKPRFA